VLIVTKLDRLGRNAIDVRATVERLAAMGVKVNCLALGNVDLTSAAGKMTMSGITAVAEFERELLIERTQAGLAREGRRVDLEASRGPHRSSAGGSTSETDGRGHPGGAARARLQDDSPDDHARASEGMTFDQDVATGLIGVLLARVHHRTNQSPRNTNKSPGARTD
jgi:hypothetical protein